MKEKNIGIVKKVYGNFYFVDINNITYQCTLRGKLKNKKISAKNIAVVGDRVVISDIEKAYDVCEGTISEIIERKNKFARAQKICGKIKEQIIASNIDNVFIISSTKFPSFKTGFIDRVLLCTEIEDLSSIIIINKIDLGIDEQLKGIKNIYENLGYKVIFTSAKTKDGLNELHNVMKNKINMFIGYSGVGKSSIINKLLGYDRQKTLEISDYSGKGKHATTNSELINIDTETIIIDTPGIREISIEHLSQDIISSNIREFVPLIQNCHFGNKCTHIHEPNCAVKKAVEEGDISIWRYENYVNMYQSIKSLY